jgi:hypothetical protein
MDANRRFTELAGIPCEPRKIIEWACVDDFLDGEVFYTSIDPHNGTKPEIRYVYPPIIDYAADAKEVLKVMMKRKDKEDFLELINPYHLWDSYLVDLILDDTGKLRDLAIEFLKTRNV